MKNKTIVLIGGGENGREGYPYETEAIDRTIVELTKKKNPNFVFLGINTNFANSYYNTMTKIYGEKFNCKCFHLTEEILKDQIKAKELINSADILYIGGGTTEILMRKLKKYNALNLLLEAYNNGCIMAGLCSGALFWCNGGVSLRQNNKTTYKNSGYFKIKTFGVVPIEFCPHYNVDTNRRTAALDMVSMKHVKKIIACDNCAALFVYNNEKYDVVCSNESASIKKLHIVDNYVVEEKIATHGNIKDLI